MVSEFRMVSTEDKKIQRKRRPLSKEHKAKISKALKGREGVKGREGFWRGKKMSKDTLYKNMVTHLRYDVSLDWLMRFEDIEKLKFLNKTITRERDSRHFTTELYVKYIEKFYIDDRFNYIYEVWLASGKEKYLRPSLDHIIPKSKGGSLTDIDNLRFLTWFENRCKNDLSLHEWERIKANVGSYFI